jgi:MFS transporter, MFS domain-containing protein family, molybdate-anion transporter
MYLFVFFWTPALLASRPPPIAGQPSEPLPFGMIFASFMCAVWLGSLLFTHLTTTMSHARLLTSVLAIASSSFLVSIIHKAESTTFWSFLLFEMCVGLYFPCAGYLKGRIVEDGVRARVYGVLRIPLNVFVVLALATMKEGTEHRDRVFLGCSGLLILASGVFQGVLNE